VPRTAPAPEPVEPVGPTFWSRSRIEEGWLFELAGDGVFDADALLPDGERLEVSDCARGMRRIAVRRSGETLHAALYVTRSGQLPAREWISSQLGVEEAATSEVLAGRPSAPLPDRGPIVCVCHGIGEQAIQIAACNGAATLDVIGESTTAGTNCGSCRPVIARLLELALSDQREAAE
jgi:assimilatory nitrate reductase catalytic subunit